MSIKDSMEFVLRGLVKLSDEERIRYEGNQTYQEIKAELVTAIATYTEITTTPAPIIQHVMSAGQVAEVIASIPPVANYASVIDGLAAKLEPLFEGSELAIMGAIAQSQADTITALTPPPPAA